MAKLCASAGEMKKIEERKVLEAHRENIT